ncbi:MAG: hypothetical protein EP326_04100 [Deltaproteobacteria bacterium]|nr:MAG: hypothetical protein EP326_04100 [Deltaproteobacteria bacterium]TNF30851.1 MAG: hypothetical protein EP319_03900 [Deltaproteobacteria bacterium]
MQLAQVILYSSHKEKLGQLLSEVFEAEIHPVGEGIGLKADSVNLLILDQAQTERGPSSIMDFYVKDPEELLELQNRLQFFAYRYGKGNDVQIESRKNEDYSYILIKDYDQREWKFTAKIQ